MVCRVGCDYATIQAAINAAQPGDTLSVAIGAYSGAILIDRSLTIQGASMEETVLNGGGATVVVVTEKATVTLSDLTISNGFGSSGGTGKDGGGIHNNGSLTLNRVFVRGNIAPEDESGRGKGAGIRNDGDLAIFRSSFRSNVAGGRGGAIYNKGAVSIDASTLCDNSASDGGGIFNEGEVTLTHTAIFDNSVRSDGGGVLNENRCVFTNCTLSENVAGNDGGGIWSGGFRVARVETRLVHCTVAENEVGGVGAGIFNATQAAVELQETIIARNGGGAECTGVIQSLGYNLDSDGSCALDESGAMRDIPGVDPQLSQFGHHDGPTLTYLLQAGSPAIDAGSAVCTLSTDQRFLPRPVGTGCDIGAYEKPSCFLSQWFERGNPNDDTVIDISDGVFILQFLFTPDVTALDCNDSGDSNDDGIVDLSDAIYILNWLFNGGPRLPEPSFCGPDPTIDDLSCMTTLRCTDITEGGGVAPATSSGYQDLWTSAEELAAKPMSGPAWESVLQAAQDACAGEATITNQDNNNNVQILAAALVYARTATVDPPLAKGFRERVVGALEKLVMQGDPRATHGCPTGCGKAVNETLAWGRALGAYVLAADLIRYRTPAFESWLRQMAEVYVACDGRTTLESFERRPNNWGIMSFGSLVAAYAYLGDDAALQDVRTRVVLGLTVGVPDCLNVPDGEPCYVWGGTIDPTEKDMTWHCDPFAPRLISQPCTLNLPDGSSLDVDGLIPDDQRRACSFCPPGGGDAVCASIPQEDRCVEPGPDVHISDWMNGGVMGARILDRLGLGIWDVGDQAFKRMIMAYLVTHCEVTCDDLGFQCNSLYNCKDWVLPVLNAVYDLQSELTPPPATNCECPVTLSGRGTGASKNAGFGAYIVP